MNLFSIRNGVTVPRRKRAEMLKADIKFGTMSEDAEVSDRFQLGSQLCKLWKLTTIFDEDPIEFILQGRHDCYYVIPSGDPRHTTVGDVKAVEISDYPTIIVLRLMYCGCVRRHCALCVVLLMWTKTRKQ